MTERDDSPEYSYVVFLDEAGDPGLRKVRPLDPDGASEWLSIGALLIKAHRQKEIVDCVRNIRSAIRGHQRPDLHFRHLTEGRKKSVCQAVAGLPIRGFVLLSNKKNMRQYKNPKPKSHHPHQWFYNYCLRLTLERVTDYVEQRSIRDYGYAKNLKVVFSNRGGTSYGHTISYFEQLKVQSRAGTLHLKKRDIKWRVVHRKLFETRPHASSAGLQLADVVASSFYQAADSVGSTRWNTEFAKILKPRMAIENETWADYGVTLQPTPHRKAKLTSDQKQIFEFYGYRF